MNVWYLISLSLSLSQDIECDSITTVQEFISHINQEIGMHDTHSTEFALMSDWPGEEDIDVFYLFPNSKLLSMPKLKVTGALIYQLCL